MGLFKNLTTDGLQEAEDRLGGFRVYDADAYPATVKAVYAQKSASSNAQGIVCIFDLDAGGEYRETFWVTNRNGENFFRNKQDETKKIPLPGFTIVDDLCLVTTNKPLSDQMTEEKVMNVYDPEVGQERPKSVPMLTELLGKKVTLGLIKQIVDKQKKDSSGNYAATGETREENVVDKIFHNPTNMTVVEAKNGAQSAEFYGAWVEKNRGQVRDRSSGKKGAGSAANGRAGRPGGMPPTADTVQRKTASLFGG